MILVSNIAITKVRHLYKRHIDTSFVFWAMLLLGCFSQFSLFKVASFRLLLKVAIFTGEQMKLVKTGLSFVKKINSLTVINKV